MGEAVRQLDGHRQRMETSERARAAALAAREGGFELHNFLCQTALEVDLESAEQRVLVAAAQKMQLRALRKALTGWWEVAANRALRKRQLLSCCFGEWVDGVRCEVAGRRQVSKYMVELAAVQAAQREKQMRAVGERALTRWMRTRQMHTAARCYDAMASEARSVRIGRKMVLRWRHRLVREAVGNWVDWVGLQVAERSRVARRLVELAVLQAEARQHAKVIQAQAQDEAMVLMEHNRAAEQRVAMVESALEETEAAAAATETALAGDKALLASDMETLRSEAAAMTDDRSASEEAMASEMRSVAASMAEFRSSSKHASMAEFRSSSKQAMTTMRAQFVAESEEVHTWQCLTASWSG